MLMGEIIVMEANPNPSLGKGDDFALAAARSGIEYDELGMFHLGSTAVVFFESRAGGTWTRAAGDSVRYGERILGARPVPMVDAGGE